jgi:hypothetical protein
MDDLHCPALGQIGERIKRCEGILVKTDAGPFGGGRVDLPNCSGSMFTHVQIRVGQRGDDRRSCHATPGSYPPQCMQGSTPHVGLF